MNPVPITADAARELLPSSAVYIGGPVPDARGEQVEHAHPGDAKPLGTYVMAGDDDVDRAVDAGAVAQRKWAALAPAGRRDALLALAARIREARVELAAVISLEMGMPIRTSVAGVDAGAEWFAHFAGWADKIEGLVAPVGNGVHDYTVPSPYGVVGAIIPWNGPGVAMAVKIAPALAAGNAVVLKPSELAPLSGGVLARLADEAGLPRGLLTAVPGGPSTGAALCAHPGVGLVSFTGGNVAGRAVGRAAGDRQVPAQLELGGKSASLVFADADVPRAARLAAALGIAQNSGQGCFLPTRLLVERSVYDQVVESVAVAAARYRVGRPFAADTVMGPVVDQRSYDRILGLVDQTRDSGAGRVVTGGGRAEPDPGDGWYIAPTVVADVDPSSRMAREEVFGPVLAVFPFDDEDEAVAMANASDYGLAGYVWTENLRRAHRVAAALDAGYVSVNSMAGLPPAAPFSGWKASGYGVEGGRQGLLAMLRTKNVHVAL